MHKRIRFRDVSKESRWKGVFSADDALDLHATVQIYSSIQVYIVLERGQELITPEAYLGK